jgi:hypothetical protein
MTMHAAPNLLGVSNTPPVANRPDVFNVFSVPPPG